MIKTVDFSSALFFREVFKLTSQRSEMRSFPSVENCRMRKRSERPSRMTPKRPDSEVIRSREGLKRSEEDEISSERSNVSTLSFYCMFFINIVICEWYASTVMVPLTEGHYDIFYQIRYWFEIVLFSSFEQSYGVYLRALSSREFDHLRAGEIINIPVPRRELSIKGWHLKSSLF